MSLLFGSGPARLPTAGLGWLPAHRPGREITREDVYWASQEGDTDPTKALVQHLRINQPSDASHLFSYKVANTRHTLTKSKFLERVGEAARAAGLEPLQGHGIRIRSTLEYLLRGVPFDVMKAKGRWAGDSFQLYLRKHAVVIAPYIQAAPIHEGFVRYTMPRCANVPTCT